MFFIRRGRNKLFPAQLIQKYNFFFQEFSLTIDSFDSIGCGLNKVGDFPFIDTSRIRRIQSFLENQTRSLMKPTLEGFAVLNRIPGMINFIIVIL